VGLAVSESVLYNKKDNYDIVPCRARKGKG
jgi:hypothetical protein